MLKIYRKNWGTFKLVILDPRNNDHFLQVWHMIRRYMFLGKNPIIHGDVMWFSLSIRLSLSLHNCVRCSKEFLQKYEMNILNYIYRWSKNQIHLSENIKAFLYLLLAYLTFPLSRFLKVKYKHIVWPKVEKSVVFSLGQWFGWLCGLMQTQC